MTDIKVLREEFSGLQAEAEKLISKVADEKRDFNAEEKEQSDKQFKRLNDINAVLAQHQKLAELAFSAKGSNVELPSEPTGRAEKEQVETAYNARERFTALTPNVRREFGKAMSKWVLTGQMDRRFATITGSTDSGILMPSDVATPIVPSAMNVLREALSAVKLSPMKTQSTRDLKLPIYTASVNGTDNGIVVPTATSEVEDESALTESIVLSTKTYHSGNFWFENRELSAVDFDLLEASIPSMAYQKELAIEQDGITTMAGDSGVTQSVATATTSGFTYANIVSLNRVLPKRYQPLKVIILSKNAYTAAENLVTTTGFPILNALDPQNSSLKFFNGTPVVYSEYLSGFGANNVVGLVLSFVGCRLRDAGEGDILQRFTQTANRQGQTGADYQSYNCWGYTPLAVAKLTCPAS